MSITKELFDIQGNYYAGVETFKFVVVNFRVRRLDKETMQY